MDKTHKAIILEKTAAKMDWCLEMMICDVYWLFLCEENVKISRKISFTSHNLSLVSPNYICPPAPRLPAAKKRAKSLLFINQPSSLSARCFQRGWKEVSEDMLQNNLKMLGKCSISSDLQGSQWKIFSHSLYLIPFSVAMVKLLAAIYTKSRPSQFPSMPMV